MRFFIEVLGCTAEIDPSFSLSLTYVYWVFRKINMCKKHLACHRTKLLFGCKVDRDLLLYRSGGVVAASSEEDHSGHATTGGATTADLSMFSTGGGGGRKLEDFLGGGGGGGGGGVTLQPHLGHFPAEAATVVSIPEVAEFDSELKTIAASFLRGFSSTDDQEKLPQPQPQQLVVAPPPSDPCPKKTLDNFGQRTSIYRGVTRSTKNPKFSPK